MAKKSWYLGTTKGSHPERIYLRDFSWDCKWYWGGGYIGNRNLHCHFDGCFLNTPDSRSHPLGSFYDPWTKPPEYVKEFSVIRNGASVWEDLDFFLDNAQYDADQWWRIKDLFKQFYAMRKAAEAFHSGGHCTSKDRTEGEINPFMEAAINKHIEKVIIPAIHQAMEKTRKEEKEKS